MRKDYSTLKFRKIPGWNDYVQDFHNVARTNFLSWIDNGRPRCGGIFDNMKESRKQFKKALDFCKKNELKNLKRKFFESLFFFKEECFLERNQKNECEIAWV